jgi:hypothetical protein
MTPDDFLMEGITFIASFINDSVSEFLVAKTNTGDVMEKKKKVFIDSDLIFIC